MFTWVGSKFDAVLDDYVLGVVSTLMTHVRPVALTAMTIWVLLYGWAVLRNEVSETVPIFLWKVVKIGLVLAFSLQSGVYISHVADTANALAMGVASTFVSSGADATVTTGPYALLDKFNDDASAQTAYTVVNGRTVVRDGQLTTVSLGPLVERHNALALRLASVR